MTTIVVQKLSGLMYYTALQAVLASNGRDSLAPGAIGNEPFDSSSPVKEPYMVEGEVSTVLLAHQLVLCSCWLKR